MASLLDGRNAIVCRRLVALCDETSFPGNAVISVQSLTEAAIADWRRCDLVLYEREIQSGREYARHFRPLIVRHFWTELSLDSCRRPPLTQTRASPLQCSGTMVSTSFSHRCTCSSLATVFERHQVLPAFHTRDIKMWHSRYTILLAK
jgi:hypothetical protein